MPPKVTNMAYNVIAIARLYYQDGGKRQRKRGQVPQAQTHQRDREKVPEADIAEYRDGELEDLIPT